MQRIRDNEKSGNNQVLPNLDRNSISQKHNRFNLANVKVNTLNYAIKEETKLENNTSN